MWYPLRRAGTTVLLCVEMGVPAGLSGVVALAAGDSDGMALKSDGTVVAWGQNYAGQANVPGGLGGVIAVSQGLGYDMALKADGTLALWGDSYSGQTRMALKLGPLFFWVCFSSSGCGVESL
jgi:alpha-tubulin suppressor-like RCC1 family protein